MMINVIETNDRFERVIHTANTPAEAMAWAEAEGYGRVEVEWDMLAGGAHARFVPHGPTKVRFARA